MSENERSNVTPLRPEYDEYRPKRNPARTIVLLSLLLLLIAGALFVLLLRGKLSGGTIRRAFAGDETVRYVFEDGHAFCAHHGGIAAVTAGGMSVYDALGEKRGTAQHIFATPVVRSGDLLAMGFDVGGTRLSVLNERGEIVLDHESEGTLLDADLSSGDALCIAELLGGYRTVLTVYDDAQHQIYRYFSATRYLNQCAISPSGEYLCATALGSSGSAYESTAVVFRTDTESPVAELSLGSELVRELYFADEETVCAITENGVQFFTVAGAQCGSYDCGSSHLRDYAPGDGFLALSLNKYQAGSQYSIVVIDTAGNLIGTQYLGEEILSLSCSGDRCAVLTSETLYLYDQQLNLIASTQEAGTASAVVMQEDGSALLISGGVGTLYVPD